AELGLHEQLQDGEKKPHKCSECGKSFKRRSNLIKHCRSHTEQQPHKCSECGKSFTRRSNLVAHQKIHMGQHMGTEGEKPTLDQGQSSELGVHEQLQDGEKKRHKCSECGKSFRWTSNLSRHRRLHRGERPYGCGVCGKSFSQKSNLIDHQKSHMGPQLDGKPTLGHGGGQSSEP
ncbi:ZNF3 protein, partial [Emberiza fucata]|nr:ZNF3 protein [Emberiza fucata]